MTATLARMGAGFADPAHGAQQTFRVLLDAMASPGRVFTLPAGALAGLAPDDATLRPPTGIGLAATLLTLLDADTAVHLAGDLGGDETRAWLRFHTGTRATSAAVAMAAAQARDVDADLLAQLALGTDDAPQDGATLIVEVDGLCDDPAQARLVLRGAGIESQQALRADGLDDAFWQWRIDLQRELPRGVDLVLVHGTRIAAIPRSTRIAQRA